MEASMLVAPKPARGAASTARRSAGSSARRSCVVVASAGGKVASCRLMAAATATAASTVAGALPCHASVGGAVPVQAAAEVYYRAMMVVAELDAATAKVAIGVAGPALSAFGLLFVARIVMSWYPRLPVTKFPYVVAYAPTEPLLAATRKLIPPLAGVDVTPVVWFGLVSFLNEILVGPQGLLVLLSQQVSN